MHSHIAPPVDFSDTIMRGITHCLSGQNHGGPITRLMSPSDLGQILKPFVFLDLFDANPSNIQSMRAMPLHPHSGIATVTVPVKGAFHFDDPVSGSTGTISYGGIEWMRAGNGVWHGKELSMADSPRTLGFQLWLALPAALENSEPVSNYIEAHHMVSAGPAVVILGHYEDAQSPVASPEGINYLLVTLQPGEHWIYQPPTGHTVGWLALATGKLEASNPIHAGELVVFEPGELPVVLKAAGNEQATFVLGSAVPHPYPLHLGRYSVHTSEQSLKKGEEHIAELRKKLNNAEDYRRTAHTTIPIIR